MKLLFFILVVALQLPTLSVDWTQKLKGIFSLTITQHDPIVYDCLNSGSVVSYRFEYKVCRKDRWWFDECGALETQNRVLSWEPLTGIYTLSTDILRDSDKPLIQNFDSMESAFSALSKLNQISIRKLAGKNRTLVKALAHEIESSAHPLYVSTRAKFVCKGQTNATLDRLSNIITLGLVSVGKSDSGWIDFYLGD